MSGAQLAAAAVGPSLEPARERLLFIEDVSAWLDVPVETLRSWRQHGKGPHSAKVGARVRYREADVQAWIDAQFDDADPKAS